MSGCYFCGGGEGVLESHHIVPQRFGGSDAGENLVDLCPTCHERLERLYNKRFYRSLGVGDCEANGDSIAEVASEVASVSAVKLGDFAETLEEADLRIDVWEFVCPACWNVTEFKEGTCQKCGGEKYD